MTFTLTSLTSPKLRISKPIPVAVDESHGVFTASAPTLIVLVQGEGKNAEEAMVNLADGLAAQYHLLKDMQGRALVHDIALARLEEFITH